MSNIERRFTKFYIKQFKEDTTVSEKLFLGKSFETKQLLGTVPSSRQHGSFNNAVIILKSPRVVEGAGGYKK